MFVHIGSGKSLKKKEVIGIFDLDTSTVSKITREFISGKEKMGEVKYNDSDLPRSFILSGDNKKSEVYLSRISTAGLGARLEEKIKDNEEI